MAKKKNPRIKSQTNSIETDEVTEVIEEECHEQICTEVLYEPEPFDEVYVEPEQQEPVLCPRRSAC